MGTASQAIWGGISGGQEGEVTHAGLPGVKENGILYARNGSCSHRHSFVGDMKKRKPLPPTYFIASLLLLVALHFIWPVKHLIPSPFRYLGVTLIVIGLWLNLWADSLFKKRQTTVKPFERATTLMVEGPFRFTRNPMYLGMSLILAGLAVVLGSLTTFAVPVAFFVAMEVAFIRHEQKALEEAFGQEFLDYRQRVRRWL